MKRLHVIVVITLAMLGLLLAMVFVRGIRARGGSLFTRIRGRATVANRLAQYGPKARQALAPLFQAKGIPYPPGKLVLLGLKAEKRLEVYGTDESGQFRFISSYPILAASGTPGPKLREGDRQVPEGLYRIESLHPNSLFHLALRLNYPNEFDRRQAQRDGMTNLGGDIMIHGSTASVGCLAMGDAAIEELFVLAADTGIDNVSVILCPVDFRAADVPGDGQGQPAWVRELYEALRTELRKLPKE